MNVSQIMSARVVSVHLDDSLQTLRELFDATGFHHLVVVQDNKLAGIISDRDLLAALSPFADTLSERARDRATLDKRAHQIMTRHVITLQPTDSVVSAMQRFNQHTVSCLPVVDARQHPVGMVSWRDILRYMEARITQLKTPHSA
ncbi:CBS domain-containing protein [Salinimonas lutimaris]|uniref:CBS domain-containing protein n=1 Tax=Salinimonas lutimaris TaxID=914153 RepID=UPI0010C003D5|nr:CBS domain-containing protein [Salinimonas lutimaris]